MKDENAYGAMLPVMDMRFDSVQGPMIQSRPNPTLSSVAPALARVGHLVIRAMAFFESNREVALRYLRDASTLLGGESGAIGVNARPSQRRSGSLAAWQAKRTVEYIEDNLGSKMALLEMASRLALSSSHFSRAFKQSFGSSPMAYVAARRVERAKLMMTSTREGLAYIAQACGFADHSHFTRSFRRIVGMNPGHWRRTLIHFSAEWSIPFGN